MKKKVLLRAPALSMSGYGTHARQVFRWLENKNVDLSVELLNWGITSWHVNPDAENGLIGRIMTVSGPINRNPDVVISLQLPNEWPTLQPVPGQKHIGISAIVETDRCNPAWVTACNKMDRVIVPTKFTKEVLKASGNLTTDVRVVHESFPDEIFTVNEGLELPEVTTTTNFLVVGQLTSGRPEMDRKNIFYTVKWFCEAFAGRQDVSLIIKTNIGTNSSLMRKQLHDVFRKLLSEVRKGMFPRIHLMTGEMTTAEMVSLYKSKKISALVSLTRGEGFGLPILEAAACDVPVICTSWSGHLDFMSMGKFVGVNYSLAEIPESRIDNSIFVRGAKWAEPVEADFKAKIVKFAKKQDAPIEWANSLGQKLRTEFSFNAISDSYDRELGDLL